MFSKFRKALLGGLLAVIIAIGPLDVSAAEINIKEISRNINNAQADSYTHLTLPTTSRE